MFDDKRKLPRFHITPCQFHEAPAGKNFSVQDISAGGLAIRLVDRSDLPPFAVGSLHQGLIKVEGSKTACAFQVKFIRGTLIGGEWVNPAPDLLAHLDSISRPEVLGPGIKQYDLPDMASTIWFHHPVGIDFLFYPPSGQAASSSFIGRWMIYIHQNFVQWEMETGIRTGRTMAEDEEGYAHGIVRLETRLIEIDETINGKLVRFVESLIAQTEALPAELKNLVITQLKGIT